MNPVAFTRRSRIKKKAYCHENTPYIRTACTWTGTHLPNGYSHSFIHSFIRSFRSFVHSFISFFIHSFIPFIHSFVRSFIHSFIHFTNICFAFGNTYNYRITPEHLGSQGHPFVLSDIHVHKTIVYLDVQLFITSRYFTNSDVSMLQTSSLVEPEVFFGDSKVQPFEFHKKQMCDWNYLNW